MIEETPPPGIEEELLYYQDKIEKQEIELAALRARNHELEQSVDSLQNKLIEIWRSENE